MQAETRSEAEFEVETEPQTPLPSYDQLPRNAQGVRSAWGMFGEHDSIGLVNLLTPASATRASRLVRRGDVFPLNAALDHFDPPLFGRPRITQEVQPTRDGWAFNEELGRFNPQASSQWDGLSHVSYRHDEFYNGATIAQVSRGDRNTVASWANRGIVGRGVLLDLESTAAADGRPYDPGTSHAFSVSDLIAAQERAGVTIERGDILLLRTGFTKWYDESSPDVRARISSREELAACGIEHTEDMARYLWDLHIAAIASDCPALEVWPMDHSPELFPFGCLHQVLLGQFGMPIGELWWLDDLAESCADDGIYEFMLTSAPANYRSFGSPANALAIK